MEKNIIKVSVIIPVYNVEEYIEECVESVVNQTLKEIEIIIVNDGTLDNSMKKIERFLSDKRIIVINKGNGGLSSARNAGLEIAKGEYISFVDSDDFIDEMLLEKLYKNAENNDIIISDVVECNNITQEKKLREIKNEIKKYNKGSYFWRYCGFSVWNKMYKRNFLIENNIKFIEGIIFEDIPFNFYSLFLSNRVKYVEETYYYYRAKRKNSILNTLNEEKSLKAYNKINIKLENFPLVQLEDIFSKLRAYIWKIYYVSQEAKYRENELTLETVIKFISRIQTENKKLNKFEKEILSDDLRIILENKMFWRVNIFDSFYWENNLFTKKAFRRIMERKIKNIFN